MKKINHRQSAKRTLNIEAEALTNLSNNLNHDFTKLWKIRLNVI